MLGCLATVPDFICLYQFENQVNHLEIYLRTGSISCCSDALWRLQTCFKKKRGQCCPRFCLLCTPQGGHISIPILPMPPPGILPGAGVSSLGNSHTAQSVINSRPATEAAFCSAVRVTLVGSTTPACIRSPYSPVAAL